MFHWVQVEEYRSGCAVSPPSFISKGITYPVALLGWQLVFEDFVYRFSLYFHMVGKGVSISSTCLLNVCQAIVISSRDSGGHSLKWPLPGTWASLSFCWILQMLCSVISSMYVSETLSKKTSQISDFGDCSGVHQDKTMGIGHTMLLLLPDATCAGIMLWLSGYMVYLP